MNSRRARMPERELSRTVIITHANGLHTRPAGRVAAAARRFDADILLRCAGRSADAKSIVSLLTLSAACGRSIDVHTRGRDAAAALDALCELLESGLDDGLEES